MSDKITLLFEKYLKKNSIFTNKSILQSSYMPDTILHRDEQIETIANILAPAMHLDVPSNIFVYGNAGTGKTLSVRHVTEKMAEVAKERNIPIRVLYANCKLKKVADTEYRIMAHLVNQLDREVPATGLPTEEIYKVFYGALDMKKQLVLIVLDEIDQLINKVGDEILYNLTRANSDLKKAQISIVGISNNLLFMDSVEPRIRSSLREEEVVFHPYNALQIQDILQTRAKVAFRENTLKEGVIAKCAAYAAREHGDARRALELLRVAGELSEREGSANVEIRHIDLAESKIERDRVLDVIEGQPKQHQATLFAILCVWEKMKKNLFTGDIYNVYQDLCKKIALRPITQRRLSDIIAELDMLGLINARIISKGRHGRTREISVSIPQALEPKVRELLKKQLEIGE